MGDAAASKSLHMLMPEPFVMWDKEIKRSAPAGTARTSANARTRRRLAAEAGVPTAELETQLQQRLGYQGRKPSTKYLDKDNWFEAVGQSSSLAANERRVEGERRSKRGL